MFFRFGYTGNEDYNEGDSIKRIFNISNICSQSYRPDCLTGERDATRERGKSDKKIFSFPRREMSFFVPKWYQNIFPLANTFSKRENVRSGQSPIGTQMMSFRSDNFHPGLSA